MDSTDKSIMITFSCVAVVLFLSITAWVYLGTQSSTEKYKAKAEACIAHKGSTQAVTICLK